MKQKSLDILGSDFNSTMVRLKAQFANPYPQMEMDFNSTMVRLKELDVKRYGAMGRNFNSTMVRLKEPACSVQPNQHLFQFHYGTIKRNPPNTCTAPHIYFNSTMVRLKDPQTGKAEPIDYNFNSTMVRLKVRCRHPQQPSFLISIPLWYD